MSKSVMLAAGEDLLVAPSRTTSSGVVLSQPGIVLKWWARVSGGLCWSAPLWTFALGQLTRKVGAYAPVTLCYGCMSAASGDESSQDNRSEHDGLLRLSVVELRMCEVEYGAIAGRAAGI
jgi:hypothetical protein